MNIGNYNNIIMIIIFEYIHFLKIKLYLKYNIKIVKYLMDGS